MRRMGASSGNEEGQILLMALAFITFVGVVGVALLSYATTNLRSTAVLRQLRAEEFAADGTIEAAINLIRNSGTVSCPASMPLLNGQTIDLKCTPNPGPTLDVTLTAACPPLGTSGCPAGVPILIARVSFAGAPAAAPYVQTWSVLR